ncbi:hypothetical protein Bca52824_031466 [Brassica carinata]|uniref:Uncharacterized protein n=1 Tax=Brassica carinata TaxID=52824 RepID=A0A8X7SC72_BRACI|nr:hypothetical protein Bca52824_031466 [Brassica carinata]
MKVKDFTASGDDSDEERIIELLQHQMQDTIVTCDAIVLGTRGVPGELSTTENEFLSGYTEPIAYGLDLEFDIGDRVGVKDEHRHGRRRRNTKEHQN